MEPQRPDYAGASIVGVVPALTGRGDANLLPAAARDARAVVLLVLDGLGWALLEAHRAELPTLGALVGGPITTVVPSTTASALTSLTTGAAPARHGIMGFRMLVDDAVLGTLQWATDNGRRPPEPDRIQQVQPFLGREVPVVTRAEFRTTGFTAVHLRGQPFSGWATPSALVELCRSHVRSGAPLVYAYYPGLDAVAHVHGLDDRFLRAELRAVDRLVADLLDVLDDDVALLVTADHGHVHVGADGWVGLGRLDALVATYAGEGRFRYLHARKGAAAELASAAKELHGADAWVFTRDQLFDEGWFGPDASPAARRRVGDVVLAARGQVAFVDPTYPREMALIGAHGSLTPDEMLVPLVAQRGRA